MDALGGPDGSSAAPASAATETARHPPIIQPPRRSVDCLMRISPPNGTCRPDATDHESPVIPRAGPPGEPPRLRKNCLDAGASARPQQPGPARVPVGTM